MNEYIMDKIEFNNLKNRNFNQMQTFIKSFLSAYEKEIDSKYTQLIRHLYQRVQDSPIPDISLGYKEYFRKHFHFEGFNNDFYSIMWDIDLAKTLIKKWELKPQKAKVSDLLEYVDVETISPEKLKDIKNLKEFEPIILVSYNPFNSAILIDGNHRVYSKRNHPNSKLEFYCINDWQSIECMAGDVFRCLYALHYNVTKIVNYYDPRNNDAYKGNLDNILISIR